MNFKLKWKWLPKLKKRMKWGAHKETIPFFLVTVAGNMLPLLFGLLWFARGHKWEGWFKFYGQGEFYIYTAGFLTAAGYSFFSFKQKNYDRYACLFYLTILIAIVVSLLYAFLLSDKTPPDIQFLKYTSIAFSLIAIFLYYIGSFYNYKQIDIISTERDETDSIMSQLP